MTITELKSTQQAANLLPSDYASERSLDFVSGLAVSIYPTYTAKFGDDFNSKDKGFVVKHGPWRLVTDFLETREGLIKTEVSTLHIMNKHRTRALSVNDIGFAATHPS